MKIQINEIAIQDAVGADGKIAGYFATIRATVAKSPETKLGFSSSNPPVPATKHTISLSGKGTTQQEAVADAITTLEQIAKSNKFSL